MTLLHSARRMWTVKTLRLVMLLAFGGIAAATVATWRLDGSTSEPLAQVERGTFTVTLTATGALQPAESITYGSPLLGQETTITYLAPEGLSVREGDLLVRLDSTELSAELRRIAQARAQAAIESQLTEVDLQMAEAELSAIVDGEGALGLEEANINLRLAERRAERLQQEFDDLKSLLDRSYITREELERAGLQLEESQAALQLARRRAEVLVGRSFPRDQVRAKLAVTQRNAQVRAARQKLEDFDGRLANLQAAIQACSLYARRPGLVVYEDYLSASPRRKIRLGDRVTPTQGIVSIPEVARMQVVSSVREADLQTIHPGQPATIQVAAFPASRLSGRVLSVGNVARSSADRPFEDKRFDLLVEVDPTELALRPEMTARIDVRIDERVETLMVPINAVFDEGSPIAYVVGRWGGVERRQIALGGSNGTTVAVTKGLSHGERVRLARSSP